ncbi:hypothetical protein EDB92DRAFT_1850555 [Lactarius akahatsu]|uniref:DUF6535 domain-containing protein n=1 Tax=Lactarius akahatsu TaxID=416441 RepID=A0AAD4LJB8_9AGAM|nr:hypothetical protein EDB92DRAFT_1850555 [Lactarius akahatsu]
MIHLFRTPKASQEASEAQAHDQGLFQGLLEDVSGIPTFAGLFAAVLTSFLINSLKNLQPDPVQQFVYYHNRSVAILVHISQQIASATSQTPVPLIHYHLTQISPR